MTSKRTVLPDLQEGGTASDGAARSAGSYGHCEPPRQWPGLAARTGRKNGTRLVEPFFVEPALPGFLVYEVTEPAIRRVPSSQVGSDSSTGYKVVPRMQTGVVHSKARTRIVAIGHQAAFV